jgi:hypothetical protein
MQDTHVYEVVGRVLFRRSGNGVRTIVDCTVVRTRAIVSFNESGADVLIPVIISGYERFRFTTWLDGWKAEDNLDGSHGDLQSGRPVDVAVPTTDFNNMVASGRPEGPISMVERRMLQNTRPNPQDVPFNSPVVAVRIDGRWVEPDSRI